MKLPIRCRNHSRATKIGQRTWKRKALCSNGEPWRSRIRKRISPSSDSSISSLRRANETRAPFTTERSSAIASSSRTKPWSRTVIVCCRGSRVGHRHGLRKPSLPPGWSSRRHLRLVVPLLAARFYPDGTRAGGVPGFYAERFDTVELNTTGYRLPAEEQFERWAGGGAGRVPVRGEARPSAGSTGSGRSSSASRALGDRLGPVQGGRRERRATTACSRSCSARSSPAIELAFDFRHESWAGVEGVVAVNDLAAEPFRYVRLREPPYSDDDLRGLAARLRAAGVRLLPPRGRADRARVRCAARAQRCAPGLRPAGRPVAAAASSR